ncbi:ATP-binding protein [Desulfovulcanus sp.]
MTQYIQRTLEPVLERAAREFPAIVLTGPRQAGKTTLLKRIFGGSHRYVSLELPDIYAAAMNDPRGFLEYYAPPVVFDEVQYAPLLFPYIKEYIDAHRDLKGQYILSGSQNLLLLKQVTESLAGRVAILRLLPLSYSEIYGLPFIGLAWEESGLQPRPRITYSQHWENFLRGFYPEPVSEPERDIALWHRSYIQTYLERDVRGLRQIGDLTLFQNFLRSLAARSGQLLNLTDIARDLGVAVNTVKSWLSILEATFQIIIIHPYFANIGKRLVKTPKVYFTDTGTLCHLVGLKDPEHAAHGPMAGAIFESAVISEIFKRFLHHGQDPHIYFWRTAAKTEIDIIIDLGVRLIPIEVKLSATPTPSMARNIVTFLKDFKDKADQGFVVYPGNVKIPLAPKVMGLPFAEL